MLESIHHYDSRGDMLKELTTTSYIVMTVLTSNPSPMIEPLKEFPGVSHYENSIGAVATMDFQAVRNNQVKGIQGYPFQNVGQTQGLEEYFHNTALSQGTTQDYERDIFACFLDYADDQPTIQLCIKDLKVAHGIS